MLRLCVLLSLAPLVSGCGIFFLEVGAGAYGVAGGNGDVRPAYGLGLAVGMHIDDPPREPAYDQDWRAAVAIAGDAAITPMGGRDGMLSVSGLSGRFDLTLDHFALRAFLRGTAILTLGAGGVTQFADATRTLSTYNGFGAELFVGPTVALFGSTNTHLSLGAAALLGVPDRFDTAFALGAQARVAFDFGSIDVVQ